MKKLILKDDAFAEEVIDLADEMVEIARDTRGASAEEVEDKVISSLANFLDAALPFDVILPGAAGAMLEAKDGEVIEEGLEKLLQGLKTLFKVDPEKKASRKAKRLRKKKARRSRRSR